VQPGAYDVVDRGEIRGDELSYGLDGHGRQGQSEKAQMIPVITLSSGVA
jgi:hypothetical protein